MSTKLVAKKREILKKKTKYLRKDGIVPAVVYGKAFTENVNVQFSEKDFKSVYKEASSTGFVDLEVGQDKYTVLVKKIVKGANGRDVIHVDLYAVNDKYPVKLNVPIKLVGESPLISKGCLLVPGADTLYLQALPKYIPVEVPVDTTALDIVGKLITVGDLQLDENIKVLSAKGARICSIAQTRSFKASKALEGSEDN